MTHLLDNWPLNAGLFRLKVTLFAIRTPLEIKYTAIILLCAHWTELIEIWDRKYLDKNIKKIRTCFLVDIKTIGVRRTTKTDLMNNTFSLSAWDKGWLPNESQCTSIKLTSKYLKLQKGYYSNYLDLGTLKSIQRIKRHLWCLYITQSFICKRQLVRNVRTKERGTILQKSQA